MPTPAADKVGIPVWLQPDGVPLSCREKIKVVNQNLEEIRGVAQDALEDGIPMGCDENLPREALMALIESPVNPCKDGTP